MSQVTTLRHDWDTIYWPTLERNVFKLQKQIYRASQRYNRPAVRRLQRLLLTSDSAKWLAVRRVTQDNRGKKTAGVDGKTALTKKERQELVADLSLTAKAMPIRRVWIPKPGKTEKRPLGILTIRDWVNQALVKMALEPEWEAKFEPNSYGFRPGRSVQDAIAAIFGANKNKQAYVLDADFAGCFDNIDHKALLDKLKCSPFLRRRIKSWLRAGILEGSVFKLNERGTPQDGIISPRHRRRPAARFLSGYKLRAGTKRVLAPPRRLKIG
jgi:RNA-directed DNA polymerase